MDSISRKRFTGLLIVALATLTWSAHGTPGDILRVPENVVTAAAETEVLVKGAWGSGPGEFGKVDEASRPGPMDFAVAGDALYVLDPVNARVQVFATDGQFRREIPIGTQTADFLCVHDNGDVMVLDAFVRRELKSFSASGELLVQAGLPPSIGLPSAIFADGGGTWIEERHNRVFRVEAADEPGEPDRIVATRNGRPTDRQGGTVSARKDGTQIMVSRAAAESTSAEPIALEFARAVRSIVALESDDAGRVYLGAACPRGPERDATKADIVLVVISPDGRLAGTILMPDAYVTDHYRKVFVTRAGEVIQMQTAEDGVRFIRWAYPARADEGGKP